MLHNSHKQVKILRFPAVYVQSLQSPAVYNRELKIMAIQHAHMIQCGRLLGSCKWINCKVKSKLIQFPKQTFYNGRNEKTHVGTWVALQQSQCRRTPWPAMSRGRNYIINENDMKVILNAIH